MSALGLLLLVGAQGTTIISIKYPPQGSVDPKPVQPAKRDLSLSYAATNIDSKEGTRVKTITVIKNVGGIDVGDAGSSAANIRQAKLAELQKNEEWAAAFRDNFETYGGLPEVPDIDDLFDFVNGKKSTKVTEKEKEKEQKPKVEITTAKPKTTPVTPKATSEHAEVDSDEEPAEKITGDAELLPNHRMVNLLRLQPVEHNQKQPEHQQQQSEQDKHVRTRESLVNVNYSTPMHSVNQFYDKYVQVLPNGYDYSKPQPCAVPGPPNSIQVTTPSGRHYDIPQSNSSGTNGGINHPYVAPALAKRTQITPAPSAGQPQPSPNYSSVNSLVPAIVQPQGNPPANVPLSPPVQTQPQLPPQGAVGAAVGGGAVGGLSTSQRPYVAPSLRNNGLGVNRGPSTPPQTQPLPPPLPAYPPGNANANVVPNYHGNGYGNRPNTFRSRGLKY